MILQDAEATMSLTGKFWAFKIPLYLTCIQIFWRGTINLFKKSNFNLYI
jgi:hypothetical protein